MKKLRDIVDNAGVLIHSGNDEQGVGFLVGLDPKKPGKMARVVYSTGGGWDHVSVSWSNRCPTWEEMCKVKRIFFRDDETVVQYHPASSEYVNFHPYCLHLFRANQVDMPFPPSWMVGPKDGQDINETIRKAEEALR